MTAFAPAPLFPVTRAADSAPAPASVPVPRPTALAPLFPATAAAIAAPLPLRARLAAMLAGWLAVARTAAVPVMAMAALVISAYTAVRVSAPVADPATAPAAPAAGFSGTGSEVMPHDDPPRGLDDAPGGYRWHTAPPSGGPGPAVLPA